MELIIVVSLMILGYSVGRVTEKRHYASIRFREKDLSGIAVTNTKRTAVDYENISEARMVSASVVISLDYFKRFLAALRNFFGGNVRSFETLVDRGRREAALRLKEQCSDTDLLCNMRIETSVIGQNANRKNSLGSIEILAYGTLLRFKKQENINSES